MLLLCAMAIADTPQLPAPPPPPPPPRVRDVPPAELPDLASRAMRRGVSRIRLCYELALARDEHMGGQIDVELEVLDRRVLAVKVLVNTTGDDALGACVVEKFQTLSFPPEVSGSISWGWELSPK